MKRLLYCFVIIFWVSSLVAIYIQGYEKVEKRLAQSLIKNESELRELFDIAIAYNVSIKNQMESNLHLLSYSNYTYVHPLVKTLTDYPKIEAYGLDRNADNYAGSYPSMLTGSGEVAKLSSDTIQEISAALLLSLSAPLEGKYDDFKWSYYLSSQRFIIITPVIDINNFRFEDELYQRSYWIMAKPENNLDRETVFSEIFEDAAGQGLIMTIATPVYYEEKFKGVVSLDLHLSFLEDVLQPMDASLDGSIAITANNGAVVARKTQTLEGEVLQEVEPVLDKSYQLIEKAGNHYIASNHIMGKFYIVYDIVPYAFRILIFKSIGSAVFIASLFAIIMGLLIKLGSSLRLSRKLARYDGVSQVYNRHTLEGYSNEVLKDAFKQGESTSLIMIDVDDFKSINDECGHAIGDDAIRFVAKKITENTRKMDIVGRYGGEEFVVTLPNTSVAGAVNIAEKIREDIERSAFHGRKKITISAGCVEIDASMKELDFSDVCGKADLALYQSKDQGKNRVSEYSGDLKGYTNRAEDLS